MKTKEELNALKKELEALNRKLAELTEDELEQVVGGQRERHYPKQVTVQCSCGAVFERFSSGIDEAKIQLCPKCRGVYTSSYKESAPKSRTSRFEERFGRK